MDAMKRMPLHISLVIALFLTGSLAQAPQAHAEQGDAGTSAAEEQGGVAGTALTLQFEDTNPTQRTYAKLASENTGTSSAPLPQTDDEISCTLVPVGILSAAASTAAFFITLRRKENDSDAL